MLHTACIPLTARRRRLTGIATLSLLTACGATSDLLLPAAPAGLHLDGSSELVPGSDARFALIGQRGEPYALTATWSSSDATVATVSSDGLVTGVGTGAATIRASTAGEAFTKNVTVRSLDGRIAFLRGNANTIAIMSLDGSPAAEVTLANGARLQSPNAAMSPRGNAIAYDCGQSVCHLPLDGTGRSAVVFPIGSSPSWTGDGRSIAARTDYSEVGVADLASGVVRRLKPSWYANRPKISPDGSRIAYECDYSDPYSGSDDLCVISTVAGARGEVLLTYALAIAWSPDGSRISYLSKNYLSKNALCVGNAPEYAACGEVLPATPLGSGMEAAWSPDGTHLIVARGLELWLVEPNGNNLVRLKLAAPPGTPVSTPSWGATSPAGP